MTKSLISLTDEQDAFARELVADGQYASVDAVVQKGLDLLRTKMEGETLETEALRELLERRRRGKFITGEEMDNRIAAIADKVRRERGV
jgi:antitoxin ParD1/3/4